MEQKILELLVVEDDPSHRADAETLWNTIREKGIPVAIDTVGDFLSLTAALEKKKYHGIISDIFYPDSSSAPAKENGISAVTLARDKGIPIVLCTSTFHHGESTQPVYKFCINADVPMIDSYPAQGLSESQHKNWRSAYNSILGQIAFHRLGGITKVAKDIVATKAEEEQVLATALSSVSHLAPDVEALKKCINHNLGFVIGQEKYKRK